VRGRVYVDCLWELDIVCKTRPYQIMTTTKSNFVDSQTGRHSLDAIYEKFAKPQLHETFKPNNPSIYIRHKEGGIIHDYLVEKVFEHPDTGFYAEGRVPVSINHKYPDYIRSTVTFNALGVSEKLAKTSTATNVFHYFTLGERYAFWANGGDYIPGTILIVSHKGENWWYKIEEAIVRRARFEGKFRKRRVLVVLLAQLRDRSF